MTVALALREILPHIANPLEIAIAFFEIQVKVHERIKGRPESLKALPHLIEMVQKFHDYLLVLRKVMLEKIEEDTEKSIGITSYVGVGYVSTDPRLSEKEKMEHLEQANSNLLKIEEIGEAGKNDIENILTYQINRISRVLAELRSMQGST